MQLIYDLLRTAPALQGYTLAKTVTARRGTCLVRLTGPRDLALKTLLKPQSLAHQNLTRESAFLRTHPDLTHELFYAAGNFAGQPWLAMHWREGEPIATRAARLHQNLNPFPDVLQLILDLCQTLAPLHEQGWLHGDLQPPHFIYANCTPHAPPLLLDWGLAHQEHDPAMAHPGALVHYCAPEIAMAMQQHAQRTPYARAAEIYALCAVGVYLLTQHPPVDYAPTASFAAKLDAIRSSRFRPPPATLSGAMTRLYTLLMQGLNREPSQRWPSVTALRHACEKLRLSES